MKRKTPLLFDVPKDSPTRKEQIEAFKAKHSIETHNAGPKWGRENYPWSACLMPAARKFGYGVTEQSNIYDAVAKVGRLLSEAGYLVEGRTEREAIQMLCQNCDIPCDL